MRRAASRSRSASLCWAAAEADAEAFGPRRSQPCSWASAMRVIRLSANPGQSQLLSRVNAGSTRSSGHLTQLAVNSEPDSHGPADLPEFDPKGGIPSSVVADFRRIVASMGEFVFDARIADLKSFDFAEPAFSFGPR